MTEFIELGLLGMFLSAFLAATILPLSSEIVLSALLLSGLDSNSLVLVATVGNVLGSLTNYALGFWAGANVISRWLRLSKEEFLKAEKRFQKYGLLSLLLAWVPVIGDPLTVVAGILRVNIVWFLLLVSIGKFARYYLIATIGF